MKGDPTLYKGYLGGHNWITHTDEGALQYLKDKYDIKTMVDVGCGPGGQIRLAKKLGIAAFGIDGDPRVREENKDISILEVDFTKNKLILDNTFDLIWSTEFVEHVEHKYLNNFLPVFSRGKYIFMTHAPPGKAGNHHVNCQPKEYWINNIEDLGYTYSEKITNEVKAASTMQREFVRENGLFFYKG